MNEKHAGGGGAGGGAGEAMPREEKRQSATRYMRLNRLPTLQEVLDRRTRPPLDLFCFYIFLQRESAEDALDFWLDVQQHENLCKAYFKDLVRSGRSLEDDWPEFAAYARDNGTHFAPLLGRTDIGRRPDSALPLSPQQQAPHLALNDEVGGTATTASPILDSHSHSHSPGQSHSPLSSPTFPSRERRDTESHGHDHGYARAPTTPNSPDAEFERAQAQGQGNAPGTGAGAGAGASTLRGTTSRLSVRNWGTAARDRPSKAPTVFQRDRAIEKTALVESAERIYLRYLLSGAEKEIYLPPSLRTPDFPSSPSPTHPSPLIPDLFHAQKVYIFRALEADAFPRFLRAKAFANLTPAGAFWRLVAGLVVLWGGFVLGFSLVFLDRARAVRVWTLLPFFIATNLVLSAYYSLSPLLAVFQQSETTPFRTMRVREAYVRRLLAMRAAWIELVCVVLTAALVCVFVFVPGHRL